MEYVTLNNGVKMPLISFGVYQVKPEDTYDLVGNAIEVGYRSFDTAQRYGNEAEVGNAIKDSGIPREEFFITTKVWITNCTEDKAYDSVIESMHKLGTDYLDLVLVHQPYNDVYACYRALERLYKEGKVKAIGVSNFYPDRLVDIVKFNEIVPQINQIETHAYHQQRYAHEIMKEYGVQHQAWAPFGGGRGNLLTNDVLEGIAKKYHKSIPQICLRYLIQNNINVVQKGLTIEQMKENLDLFDFMLDKDDLDKIHELDQHNSLFYSHQDPETIEYLMR